MNQVFLMGYIDRAPEQRTSDNGKAFTQFSLNVEDIQADGKVFKSFYRIDCYGKTGDIASGLTPGQTVFVEGKVYSRMRKKDDKKYYDLAIMGRSVKPLNSGPPQLKQANNWPANKRVEDDEIPF